MTGYANHAKELSELLLASVDAGDDIDRAVGVIADALSSGHKVLVCGNGGSAADSQHFAAELVGRYSTERGAYAAIGLSADMSIVTAVGNDYGFEFIFARQIEALGNPGDVLVVISTSGMSQNLVEAVKTARLRELKVITFTGRNANHWLADADVWVPIDSTHVAHIQEIQIAMLHSVCAGIEQLLEGQ